MTDNVVSEGILTRRIVHQMISDKQSEMLNMIVELSNKVSKLQQQVAANNIGVANVKEE